MSVSIGTKFRDTVADGNPEFTVTRKVRRDVLVKSHEVWACTVLKDPDHEGLVRHFSTSEIEAKLSFAKMWSDIEKKEANFWASRKAGEILHYHNGFGEYVRCRVVFDFDGTAGFGLFPLALVGTWRAHALAKRNPDGTVSYGYHARKVLGLDSDGAWQPSETCVWENSPRLQTENPDVPNLPPIDLSVPPLSSEEEATAKLWATIAEIRNAAINADNRIDPKIVLQRIRALAA